MTTTTKTTSAKDPLLCCQCQAASPVGMIGGYYYARCKSCLDLYQAKQQANRQAKLRRQAEAIKNAGH